jgi:hypothetical protein
VAKFLTNQKLAMRQRKFMRENQIWRQRTSEQNNSKIYCTMSGVNSDKGNLFCCNSCSS